VAFSFCADTDAMTLNNRDEGTDPEKEIHLTPSPDEEESGRVLDGLDEPAAEEDSGGSSA